MYLIFCIKSNACFVLIFMFSRTLAQDAEVLTTPSPEPLSEVPTTPSPEPVSEVPTTPSPEPVSEVICQLCNCTVPGVVDCSRRDIENPFELQDWEELKSFSPTTVDLSQNPLITITRISKLPIHHLNFSSCEISTIEDSSFVYLSELVSLDISRNKIPTSALSRRVFLGALAPDIGLLPFSKLRYMSLAYNDIHSLPQDIFAFMPGITTLDLSGNPLAFIDQVTMAAITDLVNLRELYLTGCELEALPEGLFRRQRRLRRLDLSDNRFKTVPSVLGEAVNLVYLNFGKNSLEVLPMDNAIRNLTKLEDLRLCRNSKLTTMESMSLGGLANLATLQISNNPRLTSIDADFLMFVDEHDVECWPILAELHLNNNNISSINSGFLHRWDQLVRADFTNNPYICDCKNQWMVDVLTPMLMTAGNTGQDIMICKKPQELRGVSFRQLHSNNKTLVCPDNESITEQPIPNMAIILGIMIGIFVAFPLVLVVVLLWRRGYFTRCRAHKEEEYDEETDAF